MPRRRHRTLDWVLIFRIWKQCKNLINVGEAALVGGVSKSISNITTTNPVRITTSNLHAFAEALVTIVDVADSTQQRLNHF